MTMSLACRSTRRSLFTLKACIHALDKATSPPPSGCFLRTWRVASASTSGRRPTSNIRAPTTTRLTNYLSLSAARGNAIFHAADGRCGAGRNDVFDRRGSVANGATIARRSFFFASFARPESSAVVHSCDATTQTKGDNRWVRYASGGEIKPSSAQFCYSFQERGRPEIVERNSCNKNSGRQWIDLTARFYSRSSRSNTDNDQRKVHPVNAADDIGSTSNLQSESQQEASQEIHTLLTQQSNGKDCKRPSEPSVHDVSYLPISLKPYAHLARLDKPIGTFLLLHPCLWSTALATVPLGSTHPDLSLCALFGVGSFVMRGAGCTINDMWDSQFDRDVERTRSRPLACGDLTYPQAWKFLAMQLSAGLGVLLSLPHLEQCFWWGAASLPFVATYPLAKRWTNYPQAALGLTFNWGAIMGWVAVRGEVDWSVVGPLYAGCVAWTLVYDTLYAHQDKADDAKLGLKSTALTFGEDNTKSILTALVVAVWGGWSVAGYNCGFGNPLELPYYYAGVSVAGAHLLWQVWTADLDDAGNLATRFRSNNTVGWIMFGSCVAGNMMAG